VCFRAARGLSRSLFLWGSQRRAPPPVTQGDAAIRERLLAEMQKQQWAPVATVNAVVRDGALELWGVIFDERQRNALKVAAENIAGLKAVKDHLVWIEPTSAMTIDPQQATPAPQQRQRPVAAAWPRA